MVEVLLTYFLALGGVEIELIEAFVEELVGANDCLLEQGESFGEFELLKFGEGSGGRSGGADQGR